MKKKITFCFLKETLKLFNSSTTYTTFVSVLYSSGQLTPTHVVRQKETKRHPMSNVVQRKYKRDLDF